MKLEVTLNKEVFVLDWDKDLLDFPKMVTFDEEYYQWSLYDPDHTNIVDYKLLFSKVKEYALPRDVSGNLFPVPNFKNMFKLEDRVCECGAAHTTRPNEHMSFCPMEIK